MEKVSILAITKNGLEIGSKLKEIFPDWDVYAPSKFSNNEKFHWYSESTSNKIIELFQNSSALICLFSLGAVIRLIAPYLKDKKTDPAVLVVDDKANFVISVLSGHLGGANELAQTIAKKLNSMPVITTSLSRSSMGSVSRSPRMRSHSDIMNLASFCPPTLLPNPFSTNLFA